MTQSLYIDLFRVGLDAAVAQMVDVVNGLNSFKGPGQPFSNLVYEQSNPITDPLITVKAKHFLEPIGSVIVLVQNTADEFTVEPVNEDPYKGGFNSGIELTNGMKMNGYLLTVFRGITPAMPVRIQFRSTNGKPVVIMGVLHQKSHDRWEPIPVETASANYAMKSAYN